MGADVDTGFERLLKHIREERGFDYAGYRRPTLVRRVEKRLHAVKVDDWDEYRRYLDEHPEEYSALFNTILINVTGFFRDRETWELLEAEVVPRLLERTGKSGAIRVWSAGCATGEEPYSAAMLLADALGDDAFRQRVKIYATDVDEDALAQAREARYEPNKLKEVSPERLERYFQPSNHGFVFRTDLRRAVIFGRNDLHRDPPISRVDMLLARNTLMYFSTELQDHILANFHFALTHGGFLVVGKAEGLPARSSLFVPYNLKRRIFTRDAAEVGFRMPRVPPSLEPEQVAPAELGEAAFEHGPVAQIVVDEDNRVVALNQPARALFGLKRNDVGRPLQDLEVSYRPLDLRSLIDEARKQRRPARAKAVEWQVAKGGRRIFEVEAAPLMGLAGDVTGLGIAFADVTAHRTLEEQLDRARGDLQTAYDELQATVEELETTNEELQSTNEELETTNEELQSTNEELETMNEELQSTNEELETMNDELRDRTDETVRANTFLAAVLASMQQAVVVIDRDLRVLAWNDQATELWGLRDAEVEGLHLLNLDIGLPVEALRGPVRQVLAGNGQPTVVLEGHDRRGHPVRYRAELAPLQGRSPDDGVPGVLMLLTAERT